MKRVGVGRFSAVCPAAGAPRAVSRTDPGTSAGAKRHVFLELQWQGRGGKFRHVALGLPRLRRTLGTFGIVALFTLAIFSTSSSRSNRVQAPVDIDTLVRENMELWAEQAALRERAFGLAEQLCERVEQGRRALGTADTPVQAWEEQCSSLPASDAETEAILAWLSEQSVRLEALADELAAGRVEMGAKRASLPATAGTGTVAPPNAAVLMVADMGSARRQ